MKYDPNDAEVKEFIRTTQLTNYSLIARMLNITFGPNRAWPVAMIRAERASLVRSGRRSEFLGNVGLMAFILDQMDLMTLDALVAKGQATFARFPSRSQLHRMIQNLREEADQVASGATGQENP